MTTDRDNSELLLTAFRYVSGELPSAEATEFESLLAADQSARDALADIVELSEAVAVEEFDRIQPLQDAPAEDSRRFAKWGTLIAVCVMVVITVIVQNANNRPGINQPEGVAVQPEEALPLPVTENADSVISLWSELGWERAEGLESDAFLSEESDQSPSTADEIPDWMLAAVVEDGDAAPMEMPEEMRELMDELDREDL